MFIEAKSPFGDCGGNITDAENGIIKSPNFPEKYASSGKGRNYNWDSIKILELLLL